MPQVSCHHFGFKFLTHSLGIVQDFCGEAGKPRHVDTKGLGARAGAERVQKGDGMIIGRSSSAGFRLAVLRVAFNHALHMTESYHGLILPLIQQRVIVSGKQRQALASFNQVLDCSPSNGRPVKRGRPTTQFVCRQAQAKRLVLGSFHPKAYLTKIGTTETYP